MESQKGALRKRVTKKDQIDPEASHKSAENSKKAESGENKCVHQELDEKPAKYSYFLTRIVILRFQAFLYGVAFLIAYNQNINLIGKNGLMPANKYMESVRSRVLPDHGPSVPAMPDSLGDCLRLFLNCPTMFWFFDWPNQIDHLLVGSSVTGLLMSGFILITGSANSLMMLLLWLLYHSIVNIGQAWYSFGWESQLLETGFITIFLVPVFSLNMVNTKAPPSFIAILLYRWLIVRIMLGAGLIKIRGDQCWRDLTCMNYFYETQPVPNPLSYFMHKTPTVFHNFEVLVNHFVELVAPFLILVPVRSMRLIGGLIQIKFQLVLIMSGNLSFLNWLTILPSLACLDDHFYRFFFSRKEGSKMWNLQISKLTKIDNKISNVFRQATNAMLLVLITYLSWPVVNNLLSPKQAMNTSFEPFRIVNTYGAFGSVTKIRNEVIFKGSHTVNGLSHWYEYEFNCKPGSISRRPCVISPYHYRLDWLMWFAAFQSYEYNPWLISLASKFLLNDKNFTTQMIANNPFEELGPPTYVKADLYEYKFSTWNKKAGEKWWQRKFVRSYLPPVTLVNVKQYIDDKLGWDLTVYNELFQF